MSCLHEIERSALSHKDRMPVLNDERAADRGCGIRNDIDHLLRSASRIRRIGENNIKKEARSYGALEKPKNVPDAHLRTIETEPAPVQVRAERLENRMILLHEYSPGGAPAQRLDPDGPRTREKIENGGACDLGSKGIEERALHDLSRRPEKRPVAAAQIDTLLRAGDYPHENPVCKRPQNTEL